MTLDQLNALPVVEEEMKAKWREDADPHGYIDENDVEWSVWRKDGVLVRAQVGKFAAKEPS